MKLSALMKRAIPISLALLLAGCTPSANEPTVKLNQDPQPDVAPRMVEFVVLTKAEYYNEDGSLWKTDEVSYTDDHRVDVVRKVTTDGRETVLTFAGQTDEQQFVTYFNGEIEERAIYTYDENGVRTHSELYNGDGVLLGQSERTEQELVQVGYNLDGTQSRRNVTRFDAAGNELESIWYDADGVAVSRYVYTYNEDGNELTHEVYFEGELTERDESIYDAQGRRIRQNWYSDYFLDDNLNLTWYRLYSYDDAGNCIEERSFEYDDRLISVDTFTYDEAGNRLSTMYQRYKRDGTPEDTSIYTYRLNTGEYAKFSLEAMVKESYVCYEGGTDGTLIAEKWYTYLENGALKECYDRSRDTEWLYVYHYNEQGIMTGWDYTKNGEYSGGVVYTTEVIEVPADQAEELLKHNLLVWGESIG